MLSLCQASFKSDHIFRNSERERRKNSKSVFSGSLKHSETLEGLFKAKMEDWASMKKIKIIRNYTIATISPNFEQVSNPNLLRESTKAIFKSRKACYREKKAKSEEHHSQEKSILKIQKTFRPEESKEDQREIANILPIKLKELMKRVLQERIRASNKIKIHMRIYTANVKEKRDKIINEIISKRKEKAIYIQNYHRNHMIRKHIEELRNYEYIFFYTYTENKDLYGTNFKTNPIYNSNNNCEKGENIHRPKDIKIKFNKGKEGNEFDLKYSKVLKAYYFPFKKQGVMRKRFRVNFIVDGNTIIDPRYEVDNDNNGHFYNLIESSMFRKKKRRFSSPTVKSSQPEETTKTKYWENIFQIKLNAMRDTNSVSDISEQSDAAIERLLNSISNVKLPTVSVNQPEVVLRSILKPRRFTENFATSTNDKFSVSNPYPQTKKVSFSDSVHYSY